MDVCGLGNQAIIWKIDPVTEDVQKRLEHTNSDFSRNDFDLTYQGSFPIGGADTQPVRITVFNGKADRGYA